MRPALDENRRALLPVVARLCGGTAMLTDARGSCLIAIDRRGEPVTSMTGVVNPLCGAAGESGRIQIERDEATGVEQFALPLGDVVLGASNSGRVTWEVGLFNALKESLPLIARVAGGEAILFDREGHRTLTASSTSSQVRMGPGEISEACRRAMLQGLPDIGPARAVPGAMAVRIPLSREVGLGFNNAHVVWQKERLPDQVKNGRTAKYTWDDIVGSSARLAQVLALARRAAENSSSILLVGESGTGKELFAQAIHNASPRRHKPFVAINCAALPESLVESTLFGYVEGTFTGAQRGGRPGLFEQANGGTLLFDEISEMRLDMQAKLLRVTQERDVCRIGSATPIPVDVRIVATSNQDLLKAVHAGRFRHDLYYRLNVIDIHVPPLRERKQDLPALVAAILDSVFREGGPFVRKLHPEAMARLAAYDWPGNVRELHNVLERGASLATGDVLLPQHLPTLGEEPAVAGTSDTGPAQNRLAGHLIEAEKLIIVEALKRNHGHRSRTAAELGISTTTLWRRLQLIHEARPVRGNGAPAATLSRGRG